MASRPASDSDTVGTVRKFVEPVMTNRAGDGSRSTAILIANTSGSPARWISSTTGGLGCSTNPTGSLRAAASSAGSSSVAKVPPKRSQTCRASVVLPVCRSANFSTLTTFSALSPTSHVTR